MIASRHTLRDVFLGTAQKCGTDDLALVTVVGIRGSAFRQRGARMIVFSSGEYLGSISSGCLEDAVAEVACGSIRLQDPTVMRIDTRKYYGCDGEITLLIEPVGHQFVKRVATKIERREPFLLASNFSDESGKTKLEDARPIQKAWGPENFLHLVEPSLRIVLIGSGLDAVAMGKIAVAVGVEVLHLLPPGDELDGAASGRIQNFSDEEIPADSRTGIVIMTHRIGRDALALAAALRSDACYVGLLGSRRRCSEVTNAALELDVDILEKMTKLRAPVGLDIGSETPEEIALSAVAEFSAVATGRDARPLAERSGPLHAATQSDGLREAV